MMNKIFSDAGYNAKLHKMFRHITFVANCTFLHQTKVNEERNKKRVFAILAIREKLFLQKEIFNFFGATFE